MNENFFGERVTSQDGKTVLKRRAGVEYPIQKEIPKVENNDEAMKKKMQAEIDKFMENRGN